MAVVKGKDLMLFKQSGATLKAWGAATSHTLNVTAEMQEISNKDTGKWGSSQPGAYNWTVGTDCMLVQTDFDDIMKAMISGDTLHVVFVVASNANADGVPAGGWTPAAGGWEGDVLINSVDANAPYDGPATYTVSFTGVGPLTQRGAEGEL
jgi:predicted secreted protein